MVKNSMNQFFFLIYSKHCCWYLSKDWCNVIFTLTRKSYFMKECDVLKFDVSITSAENLEKFWFISKVVNKYFRIVSFLERNVFDQTDALSICTWFLKNQAWKIQFRLKIQFVKLDFSKLIFQKSSTDWWGVRLKDQVLFS